MNMPAVRMCLFLLVAAAPSLDAAEESVRYRYDEAGRLVAAWYAAGTTNAAVFYGYDAGGNRTNSVSIGANDTRFDSDGDTLGDLAELQYFGHLDQTATGDPDLDGLVNRGEFDLGGDPTRADTDGDGMDDLGESIAGTGLGDPSSLLHLRVSYMATRAEVGLEWSVVPDRTYQIQVRYELGDGGWQDWGPRLDATSAGIHQVDSAVADAKAFFRLDVRRTQ